MIPGDPDLTGWTMAGEEDFSLYGEWGAGDPRVVTSWATVRSSRGALAIVVADMNSPNHWNDALLDAATALVIAAPDLLMAALGMVRVRSENWDDEDDPDLKEAWLALDAAIAKAGGLS